MIRKRWRRFILKRRINRLAKQAKKLADKHGHEQSVNAILSDWIERTLDAYRRYSEGFEDDD